MPHAFQYFSDLKEAAGSLDRIGSFIKSRVPAPAPGKAAASDRHNVSPFRRRDTNPANSVAS
jgi:hypothetical protein